MSELNLNDDTLMETKEFEVQLPDCTWIKVEVEFHNVDEGPMWAKKGYVLSGRAGVGDREVEKVRMCPKKTDEEYIERKVTELVEQLVGQYVIGWDSRTGEMTVFDRVADSIRGKLK